MKINTVRAGALPETGFLRLPQVLAVFPISRSSWYAGVKTGRFPAPHRLGPRMSAWRVEDIKDLISGAAGQAGRDHGR